MLSPRLEKVASLVPEGAKIADVGTDHAYLPIYLMENGISESAVATDIHKGPIDAANSNIAAAGVGGIKTILCDFSSVSCVISDFEFPEETKQKFKDTEFICIKN